MDRDASEGCDRGRPSGFGNAYKTQCHGVHMSRHEKIGGQTRTLHLLLKHLAILFVVPHVDINFRTDHEKWDLMLEIVLN